jgi:hypothetical protein
VTKKWNLNFGVRCFLILGMVGGLSGCALDNSCQESSLVGTWLERHGGPAEDALRFEPSCDLTYVDCGGRGNFTMSTAEGSGSTVLTINEWNSSGVGSGPIECGDYTVGTYDCDYVVRGKKGEGRTLRIACARRDPGSGFTTVPIDELNP